MINFFLSVLLSFFLLNGTVLTSDLPSNKIDESDFSNYPIDYPYHHPDPCTQPGPNCLSS